MVNKNTSCKKKTVRKYNKLFRYFSLFLTTLFTMLCFTGCWSQWDIAEMAIVLGTAIDTTDKNNDEIKLTAQVVKASAIGVGQEGGGSNDKAYVNVSNVGTSMFSAIRGITRMQSRKLYFAHNELIVLSSDLVKHNTIKVLDGFLRDHGTRMNVYLFISKGEAANILDADVELEKTPAKYISKMIENQQANSETVLVTLRDFAIATITEATYPVIPIIEIYEKKDKHRLRLEGTAVFKNAKMVGELNNQQTRGFLLITGKSKGRATTLETPWGQVIIETFNAESKLKPIKYKDGSIGMRLRIENHSAVQSNETSEDMTTPEKMQLLKDLLQESIVTDVNSALKQAQSLSTDIFGFGAAIEREFPDEWNALRDDWENLFPKIKLEIEIDPMLHGVGGLIKPVVPGGFK